MTLEADSIDDPLVRQVQKALGKGSSASALAPLLYGRKVLEGLGALDPVWLASNARDAADFIAQKPKGLHKIQFRQLPVGGPHGLPESTLIEILNDDMPFLVDSVMGELQARGLAVRLLLHPIFKTKRDKTGRLQEVAATNGRAGGEDPQESYIAVHLPPLTDAAARELVAALSSILADVRIVVADWAKMRRRVQGAIGELEMAPASVPRDLLIESIEFLRWLEQDNFTLLGQREFDLAGDPETGDLVSIDGSGLGVLRDPDLQVLRRGTELVAMTPEIRRFFFAPAPLIITKANVMSRVHRRLHMDYVGIKTYRSDGSPKGELRIVGLFTSQAYVRPPAAIPFLRHKVQQVLAAAGYPPGSHAAKALAHILDTFPRDELFQIGVDRLQEWAEGILDLETRPRVRLFVRIDRFDRFVSALVYVPRDRYSSQVRERIGALLSATYAGRVAAFYPYFPAEGPLVRVQLIIGRYSGATPVADVAELERQIAEIVRTWPDRLADALATQGPRAAELQAKYGNAFSAGYAETFPAERALNDIERIERLGPQLPVAIDFYRAEGAPAHQVHAAIYRFGAPIPLSERVPILENLGFSAIDERSYHIMPHFADGDRLVTLHDMVLERSDGTPLELEKQDRRLEAAFLAVFRGDADSDGFNRLIIAAGTDWRETAMVRAYGAYLRQLGSPFTLRYLSDTLARHAGVTRDLIELFHLRFDPDRVLTSTERVAAEAPIRAQIEGALAAVPSLDEDRILRQFLNLISATVRTNFYQRQTSGAPPATIAFKLDSKAVDAAPQPRPFREVWVYSPRVEGIHLRFAAIARGGIRWSDRAQDFRTEVLGLVRAQLVKNAVIVPSGAKGGFLPKQLPRAGSREEIQREGVAAYRIFISTLLDITDNIVDGRIVPPVRVVRHDGDDAYLVVAADKGTATFSDIANEISAEHGFWLGDAFASGGSVGYDHKQMAITARGAWECVKRHFREMDIDIQRQPFTVIGVGDMSGDVFGNGMLLSKQTRLLAAFDHRDIFIDPDPNPATSFTERRRLFDLPRSSWQDYDKAKIAKGGGVFSRGLKSIAISDEMRKLFDLEVTSLTPNELIRVLLKSRADLIFFGGIGTYVRASTETDADAGDRANDPLRVTGAELRARVIGEGANLGMTQKGRIEFAQRGGRLNTDFIDNSAGVNTSDQEVNIKIALGPATRARKLTPQARKELLVAMTDDVAANSLRNNYQQSLALSLAERQSVRTLPDYALLMRTLQARGLFDRRLEALPSDAELAERARGGRGLTRPELSVLLSYAKIALTHDLLASKVPDEPQVEPWLTSYFPAALRDRFAADIASHSLRREIITTGITNAVVNRCGPPFAIVLADETRCGPSDAAHAFLAVRDVFDLPQLWQRIDALDGAIKGEVQLSLYQTTQDLLRGLTPWFLRDKAVLADMAGTTVRHQAGVAALKPALDAALPPRQRKTIADEASLLIDGGVPTDLAADVAALSALRHASSITRLAEQAHTPVPDAARAFFAVGEHLRLGDIADKADAIPTQDYYDRIAITQALSALSAAQSALAAAALQPGAGGIEGWIAAQDGRLDRVRTMLEEIAGKDALTVSRLLVAAGQLGELVKDAGAASPMPGRTGDHARSAASGTQPARMPLPRSRS